MKRLCLYGGTFDPVHNGHIHFAKKIVAAFLPDGLFFVPASYSPFKQDRKHAGDAARLDMLRIASQLVPASRVSRAEIDRKGISYTLDTLMFFNAAYPDSRLFWVIGDDNLELLHKWKGYPEHFRYCDFIILPRYHGDDLAERIDRHPHSDQLHPLYTDTVPVSSTEIRKRIAEGKSISAFVPRAINDYIYENELYR